ncbi:hypothetical protein G6F24_016983 [Rhizopus arrhizus]|nr:hypothetical protein G6F24_016983 [Rhizopus arrhizus]
MNWVRRTPPTLSTSAMKPRSKAHSTPLQRSTARSPCWSAPPGCCCSNPTASARSSRTPRWTSGSAASPSTRAASSCAAAPTCADAKPRRWRTAASSPSRR